MSPEQRKIARHTLGLDNPDAKGRSYRNRYYASAGHPSWATLHEMVGNGWMNLDDQNLDQHTLFYLTKAGAVLALEHGERLDPEDFP